MLPGYFIKYVGIELCIQLGWTKNVSASQNRKASMLKWRELFFSFEDDPYKAYELLRLKM